MFGYAGQSESDVHELHSGLKRACADDPTLSGIAAGCSRHCHGWGYVILAGNGLFHYRTAKSIYDDLTPLPPLEGEIRAIFHGRFASDPTLAGPIFSHPFVAATDSEILFLAHNGSVQPDHLPARNVDSEWVLGQIIEDGDLEPRLAKTHAAHCFRAQSLGPECSEKRRHTCNVARPQLFQIGGATQSSLLPNVSGRDAGRPRFGFLHFYS